MVCVTLYSLLVSSNVGNVQSLLHGKCPENSTNPLYCSPCCVLWCENAEPSWFPVCQSWPESLGSFLLASQCTAKRKSRSSDAAVASASGSLCPTKGTRGDTAGGRGSTAGSGKAGPLHGARASAALLLRGVKHPLCAPPGSRPCTAEVKNEPAWTADGFSWSYNSEQHPYNFMELLRFRYLS